MVTSSPYVGDGIHEKKKKINVQNAKMSKSNEQIEENMGFTSNNVCLQFDFTFLLVISKGHLFLFICMKVVLYKSS